MEATNKRWTIADMRAASNRTGYHWFDRDSMRFFNTVIYRTVYNGPGGIYFVTGEHMSGAYISSGWIPGSPRRYTVRRWNPETMKVETIGEFNKITDLDEARAQAKARAKGYGYSGE
jgi:hypothetical protein